MNVGNIPLPQDTRLYEALNCEIIEPRSGISVFSLRGNNDAYIDFRPNQLKYSFYNQTLEQFNLFFDDKNISSTRGSEYFALNGFDYGFDFRFLNNTAPTICFAPLIKAVDSDINGAGTNVNLTPTIANTYTISDYTLYLSNTLQENNLILLRNQTTNFQNRIYRVTNISGNQLTVYDDSNDSFATTGIPSINAILSQNQNYIFTRVQVVDRYGTSYYGLYNTGGLYWISQTQGVRIGVADYGISFETELTSNTLPISTFSAKNIIPQLDEKIAINILTNGSGTTGGKSTGLYIITKIANGLVYFQPIYAAYVFIHQFIQVLYDLNTSQENYVWYVNPQTVGATNYLYGNVNFCFDLLQINNTIISNQSTWAQQVGGANDTVLGFTVFTNLVNNNYILNSDCLRLSVKAPTWASQEIRGLSVKINYSTSMLSVSEEASIQ